MIILFNWHVRKMWHEGKRHKTVVSTKKQDRVQEKDVEEYQRHQQRYICTGGKKNDYRVAKQMAKARQDVVDSSRKNCVRK